jgi:aerobic carbon-monoxide dehydrogenase medium subunit
VIPASTRYVRAASLDEALEALAEPDATALAGGQSLVSVMKLRIARPSLLVDIGRLDLAGVELGETELRVGALTTWADLARAPELRRPALSALAECATGIGDLQIRNRGTIGGGLAHADPASDMPAVVLALGARLVVRSTDGERTVDASEFFLGPFRSAVGERELLTEVVVPLPPAGSGSAYSAVDHPASGFALAGAAALVHPDGSRSMALTGVGARGHAFLLPDGEDPGIAIASAGIYGDRFAPAAYRQHLAGVVVQRAVGHARARAEEDATWQA